MTDQATTRPVDDRMLIGKVERLVDAIERSEDPEETVRVVSEDLVKNFRKELGVWGGRLYRRLEDDYQLRATFGDAKPVEPGLKLPATYPPIAACLERGVVSMQSDDPRVDHTIEENLGVREFAVIEVGDGAYILAFNIAPGAAPDDILFSLQIVRHTINQKLREERWQEVIGEARRIQAYPPYEIAARIAPLESVGGDFYDFIPISDKVLGVALADVSGHGLPSALQVREVRMGLRMGMARDFKIVRTMERLNEIIHQSTLASRFVALFYGELEPNGNFVFVNAGHIPPIHLRADGTVRNLDEGGPVLGPVPKSAYARGFISLRPGDLVVLFTDGIVETSDALDEELGVDGLIEIVREHRSESAEAIVEAIFEAVEHFGHGPANDDRTVVVVRHT